MLRLIAVTAGLTGLVAGCSSQPTNPESPAPPSMAAGNGKVDQNPRAQVSFADSVDVGAQEAPVWVPAGYQGDGRLRDGTPGGGSQSNEYQGSFCGVNAIIGTGTQGQSTTFAFDPDQDWSASLPASCQPSRSILIYVNGPGAAPGQSRQHRYFPGLGSMAPGDILITAWHDGTAAELGVNLWFDDAYPPASSLRWTRLPDVIDEFGRSVRQWRIETQGTHRAMGFVRSCTSRNKCSQVPTGITYYLPFAMTVTEVPYPYPTYP